MSGVLLLHFVKADDSKEAQLITPSEVQDIMLEVFSPLSQEGKDRTALDEIKCIGELNRVSEPMERTAFLELMRN